MALFTGGNLINKILRTHYEMFGISDEIKKNDDNMLGQLRRVMPSPVLSLPIVCFGITNNQFMGCQVPKKNGASAISHLKLGTN